MSHVLAFVAGFFACFAWFMYLAFGPVTIRRKRKPEPDEPGGGWDG